MISSVPSIFTEGDAQQDFDIYSSDYATTVHLHRNQSIRFMNIDQLMSIWDRYQGRAGSMESPACGKYTGLLMVYLCEDEQEDSSYRLWNSVDLPVIFRKDVLAQGKSSSLDPSQWFLYVSLLSDLNALDLLISNLEFRNISNHVLDLL